MELIGKQKLMKLKSKNRGNTILSTAIDKLIKDIESAKWKSKEEVMAARKDADCVHNEGFYFFDMHIHRTMVLLEFSSGNEDEGVANIKWVGTHKDYESTFKNNKSTIEKWLRSQGLIE